MFFYNNGYIYPAEFYKKYTQFSSQEEMIEKAREEGIKIEITKNSFSCSVYEKKIKNESYKITIENIDKIFNDFFSKYTQFSSQEEMIEKAKQEYSSFMKNEINFS
jgi:hypothetical protein